MWLDQISFFGPISAKYNYHDLFEILVFKMCRLIVPFYRYSSKLSENQKIIEFGPPEHKKNYLKELAALDSVGGFCKLKYDHF